MEKYTLVGKKGKKFKLSTKIDEGTFGSVYNCTEIETQENFVVKFIS